MRVWCAVVFGAMVAGTVAQADPVSESAARKMLFSLKGAELVVLPDVGLDDAQSLVVQAILQGLKDQGADGYYGALSLSPTFFDLMASDANGAASSGLLQIATQYHSPEAAGAVAFAACEAARKGGQGPCVVAGLVLPRKYSAQSLQMSANASEAFKEYDKERGPKAMAISAATTAFASGRGEAAELLALTACNQAAVAAFGQQDCEVVIRD